MREQVKSACELEDEPRERLSSKSITHCGIASQSDNLRRYVNGIYITHRKVLYV